MQLNNLNRSFQTSATIGSLMSQEKTDAIGNEDRADEDNLSGRCQFHASPPLQSSGSNRRLEITSHQANIIKHDLFKRARKMALDKEMQAFLKESAKDIGKKNPGWSEDEIKMKCYLMRHKYKAVSYEEMALALFGSSKPDDVRIVPAIFNSLSIQHEKNNSVLLVEHSSSYDGMSGMLRYSPELSAEAESDPWKSLSTNIENPIGHEPSAIKQIFKVEKVLKIKSEGENISRLQHVEKINTGSLTGKRHTQERSEALPGTKDSSGFKRPRDIKVAEKLTQTYAKWDQNRESK